MQKLLSTKEVAQFLGVNEKMVYTLISEKKLPATKITGKWIFPQHLVEQWIEVNTSNYPTSRQMPENHGLLVIIGSHDPLLERAISLFNTLSGDYTAVFGCTGSMGGLKALRQKRCHIASSHLVEENSGEYNFDFAHRELEILPAVINFSRREQGLMVGRGNPKNILKISDLSKPGMNIANRPLGTGTRLLLDQELRKNEISVDRISGYENEFFTHLDAGLEILADRADAALGIRAAAAMLGLGFIPVCWERYDLLISKDRFFEPGVQQFIEMLNSKAFADLTRGFPEGYDLRLCGKMLFGPKASLP